MPSVFAKPNKFKGKSHSNVLTCDMGKLVPFFCEEVLPGDEWRIKTDAIVRLAPLLAPVFAQVDLYTHYFFVPNRLLWDNWEKFITHGLETGTDSSVKPYFVGTSATSAIGTLFDYLDYPVADSAGSQGASVCTTTGVRFDILPVLAYNKIFNDWYRSEFLQSERLATVTDGAQNISNSGASGYIDTSLATRCWPRDYMTSALPFTQLGSPVTLPLGTSAPVFTGSVRHDDIGGVNNYGLTWKNNQGVNVTPAANQVLGVNSTTGETIFGTASTGSVISNDILHPDNLFVDLTRATSATINDIRTAFQLQRILERKARSGNRYVEYLASSFGVRSPDARLQRAEFLGGGKSPVMISEVLQTSAATQTSPQGQMAGHGFGASRTFAVNKAFTEHGFILGILSVMPKTSYFQGRKRSLCRWSWTDYMQPELQHVGEQPVFKSELVCDTSTAGSDTFDNGDIFGYQPRYEEYRRSLNEVHGDFRTNLAYWHLARIFSSTPSLNSDFVSCNPSKRIFAAGDQADRPCWIEMFFDVTSIRPMSKHGNPGMVDH